MKQFARTRRIFLAALAAVLLAGVGATVAAADDGSAWTASAAAGGDGMTWA